mmetsp:Transcript_29073/g.73186  ORF Transcript_29073/g.73186 Transcript_29073/m.73186 type:complete len:218 (+) Transcript_29073:189-842(+)
MPARPPLALVDVEHQAVNLGLDRGLSRRLGDEAIKAKPHALLPNLGSDLSRECHNRNVRPPILPQALCGLHSVQHRHPQIHKDQVIQSGRCDDHLKGLEAIASDVAGASELLDEGAEDLLADHVIVDDEEVGLAACHGDEADGRRELRVEGGGAAGRSQVEVLDCYGGVLNIVPGSAGSDEGGRVRVALEEIGPSWGGPCRRRRSAGGGRIGAREHG